MMEGEEGEEGEEGDGLTAEQRAQLQMQQVGRGTHATLNTSLLYGACLCAAPGVAGVHGCVRVNVFGAVTCVCLCRGLLGRGGHLRAKLVGCVCVWGGGGSHMLATT